MKQYISHLSYFLFLFISLFLHKMVWSDSLEEPLRLQIADLTELSLEQLLEVQFVSIATGMQQSASKAPAATTVITSQDIEAMGAIDLDEALETVPGLHVARYNIGYSPIYTFRGIYTEVNPQVLVMINGIPIKNLYFGNQGLIWGGMPLKNVARIEVIRGPGSALFGADAFAGVINIITKTKNDFEGTDVGGRVGSFNRREGWLLHSERYKGFDVAFAWEYLDTDGQRETVERDAQTTFDKLYKTHASHAPGPVNLQRLNHDVRLDIAKGEWRLRGGYQGRHDQGNGAGVVRALDPTGRYADDRFNADLTYDKSKWSEDWDVTAQLSYFEQKRKTTSDIHIYPNGAFGGTYPNGVLSRTGVSERQTRMELAALYRGFNKHLLRGGAGYVYGDLYEITHEANYGVNPQTGQALAPGGPIVQFTGTPYAFAPEKTRKNWYLFLQEVWTMAEKWELTMGVRYDDYSDFGHTVNPRAALVWQTLPTLSSKLLYGHAFRAPALYDLYANNPPVTVGNPNLEPETIDTWELGFDYRPTESLHFTLNLFDYRWKDAILFKPLAERKAFVSQNLYTQIGHGLELEARWAISRTVTLTGNVSVQSSQNISSHLDPGRAPGKEAFLRADWLIMPQWSLNVKANWIADRRREPGDSRPLLDDYTTVDVALLHKNTKGHWTFSASIRNLFDTDAREPSLGPDANGIVNLPYDLPLEGRNFFLEGSYQF